MNIRNEYKKEKAFRNSFTSLSSSGQNAVRLLGKDSQPKSLGQRMSDSVFLGTSKLKILHQVNPLITLIMNWLLRSTPKRLHSQPNGQLSSGMFWSSRSCLFVVLPMEVMKGI